MSRESANASPTNPSPRLGSSSYPKLAGRSKILALRLISFNAYYYPKLTYPKIVNYRI